MYVCMYVCIFGLQWRAHFPSTSLSIPQGRATLDTRTACRLLEHRTLISTWGGSGLDSKGLPRLYRRYPTFVTTVKSQVWVEGQRLLPKVVANGVLRNGTDSLEIVQKISQCLEFWTILTMAGRENPSKKCQHVIVSSSFFNTPHHFIIHIYAFQFSTVVIILVYTLIWDIPTLFNMNMKRLWHFVMPTRPY